MKNQEKHMLYNHVIDLQNSLALPECFELSTDKMRHPDTIKLITEKIANNNLNMGDSYVILEFVKQWLLMQDCEDDVSNTSSAPAETDFATGEIITRSESNG